MGRRNILWSAVRGAARGNAFASLIRRLFQGGAAVLLRVRPAIFVECPKMPVREKELVGSGWVKTFDTGTYALWKMPPTASSPLRVGIHEVSSGSFRDLPRGGVDPLESMLMVLELSRTIEQLVSELGPRISPESRAEFLRRAAMFPRPRGSVSVSP